MPKRKPAVTEGPRAVLYLRQSVAREESISLELQETAGREYAQRQGYRVVAVEQDPGISGRTWKRPAVQRVMTMIEAGAADVVVLWKWSRLSRSRLDWAVAADRVETAGGRIESATEPLDTTTSTGRFARGMLTEFAAFESERMGDVWREAHVRRVKLGLPANGKPRFGYSYTREEGFTPDAVSGPVLAQTYRRYILGESVYSLVQWLNEGPTRPVGGYGANLSDGLWSDRTLRRVMDSGFGAGLISYRGEQLPGAHPALIEADEWNAYMEARHRRAVYRRVERSEYLLSGLVRCVCGSRMNAGQFGSAKVAKYRCKAAHDKRTHTGGYVMASFVEEYVYAWLVERQAQITAAIEEARADAPRRKVAPDPSLAIARKLAIMDSRIDKLGETLIETDMPYDSYQRLLAKLTAEKAALETARVTAEVRAKHVEVEVLPGLLANWHRLAIPVRREYLRSLMEYVEVTPGRPRGTFRVQPRE